MLAFILFYYYHSILFIGNPKRFQVSSLILFISFSSFSIIIKQVKHYTPKGGALDFIELVPFCQIFLPRPAVPLPKARGCVLSAWFTFIYRATGLRAVGVLGECLTDSRGSARSSRVALPSPFVSLLYHRTCILSRPFFGYLKPHSLRGFKVAILSGYFVSLSLSRFCVLFGSLLSRSRPCASWSAVCRKTLTSPAISRSQFTAFFNKVLMLTLYHFAGPAQRFVGFSFPFCVFIISQDLRPVKTFFNFFCWGRALRINPLEPPSQVGDFVTPLDCLYCITS